MRNDLVSNLIFSWTLISWLCYDDIYRLENWNWFHLNLNLQKHLLRNCWRTDLADLTWLILQKCFEQKLATQLSFFFFKRLANVIKPLFGDCNQLKEKFFGFISEDHCQAFLRLNYCAALYDAHFRWLSSIWKGNQSKSNQIERAVKTNDWLLLAVFGGHSTRYWRKKMFVSRLMAYGCCSKRVVAPAAWHSNVLSIASSFVRSRQGWRYCTMTKLPHRLQGNSLSLN